MKNKYLTPEQIHIIYNDMLIEKFEMNSNKNKSKEEKSTIIDSILKKLKSNL